MIQYYEHHINIRKNKSCPFKLAKADSNIPVFCNWHTNLEIFFVSDGRGVIQYDAEQIPAERGDVVVINSGALHCPYSDTRFVYYYLIIDESFCLENGIDITAFEFEKKLRDAETEALFGEVIQSMTKHGELKDPLSVATIRGSVLSLLIDLCKNHARWVETKPDKVASSAEYVKRVLKYVNENYSSPITLEVLAELCGVTKFHLAREFKRYTGQTVFTYINVLRCKKAELCLSEGMSVAQAARESGFESLSYFSRTYRRLMGVCPSKAQ